MARLSFSQVARVQVKDQTTNLALEKLTTTIREILEFLQPWAAPEEWKPLVLATGWARYTALKTYNAPEYRKSQDGRTVEMRGYLVGAGATILQLPTGYRPIKTYGFATDGSGAFARVDVQADGFLKLVVGSGAAYLSLDGIHFEVT